MVNILKKFGRDQKKIEDGVKMYLGVEDDEYIVVRHGSSKRYQTVMDGLTGSEKRAMGGKGERPRAVAAKIVARGLVVSCGKGVEFAKGVTEPSSPELEKLLNTAQLDGLVLEILDFATDAANYGLDDFEDDSKNSKKPSKSS